MIIGAGGDTSCIVDTACRAPCRPGPFEFPSCSHGLGFRGMTDGEGATCGVAGLSMMSVRTPFGVRPAIPTSHGG